ncbi:tRNA-dihydrouridine synthase-like protein 4-like protein [Calycina marina]|uniref:tRNA-dihydrouridine(20a/20b) synthase [NAD(P)+] n=1 Tax=Calycina marina TaxID=1763456 RepID=A0A9P7Z452_9HELO|nr:tRNA-dihydrouridine synthase-like protein 4-like protein [Calycina marina]
MSDPLKLFDIAKSQNRPLYAAAPMVRYSKLAFRKTVAEYGVDLTWTPMILAKEFNRSEHARNSDFTTCANAPPTIVQFGANSPFEISRATTLLAPHINGVDINCGCPQSWACAETLGAALMHKPELVASMITSAKESFKAEGFEAKKTVSVKIRIHKDLRQTVDFVKTMESVGVDFITIHGRLKSTPSSLPVNIDAIKLITEHTTVPTLSNGDVYSVEDAELHRKKLGVDGVMSARGLLENPAMFKGHSRCPWEAVEVFMLNVVKAPLPFKLVVHHLSEMVGTDHLGGTTAGGLGKLCGQEDRTALMECKDMLDILDWYERVKEVMQQSLS